MGQSALEKKLDELRSDYLAVKGQVFGYFFCPILWMDEAAELCRAHVINQAITDAPRAWTVQRKDVDNFYGSLFESRARLVEFTEEERIDAALFRSDLSPFLNPTLKLDGKLLQYYMIPSGRIDAVSPSHMPLLVETEHGTFLLGLKVEREAFISSGSRTMDVEVDLQLSLSAFVTMLKSAHLSLFSLLGYRYGLSSASHFLGREILGQFFLTNNGKRRSDILDAASHFFNQFRRMALPVKPDLQDFEGTISDNTVLFCKNISGEYWAKIVLVRAAHTLHAVLVPFLDNAESTALFAEFLSSSDSWKLNVNRCVFKGDHWSLDDSNTYFIDWDDFGPLT